MDKDFAKLHSQFGMTGADRKGLTAATYNASEENKGTVMDNVGTAIGQIVDNATNSPAIDQLGPISINDNKSLGEQQQELVNQIGNALEPIKLTPPKEPNFFDSAMQRFFGKSESQLRAEEALQIAQKLNIGADTVMNTSDEGFKHARVIADRIDRGETLESIQTNYPELATLKYESQADAINTLANMENIKQTRGVFDSIEQNTSAMNDQMKLGRLGTKLAFASENEKGALLQQINEISNRLQEYRKDDDSNFFGRIVGDTAAQVYMMGKQALVGGGIGGAIGAAGGAVLGAAIGKNPATAGQFALQGAKLLGQAGMAEQMGEMSFGLKYIELVNKKDTNGNRVYSDSEARNRAAAYAAVDTGIEFYAMRLGAKAITKATPASQMASKTLTTGIDTSVATMNKGMGTIVGQALKRGVKAGIPELVEEGLQDVNEKVQHNLFRNDNDMEGPYSAGDIATGAIGAMWNAAPSVVGLAGLGGIAGGVRMANDFRKWNNFSSEQKMLALQEEQNRNAAQLMANIRKDSLSNQFAKQNAETYSQLVQKYAQKNNIPTAYINMHEMMETSEGQKAVREMVESGIVTDEQVANSIEAETPIEVPIGTFAQHSASLSDDTMNALQDTTFYTEGGQSMRTITKDKEAYATAQNDIADELKNHKASVKADLIKEYFGDVTPTQKEVLDTVLDDADSVKQTYNATVLQAQTDFFEKYNQEYQAYKQAKENGTLENSSDYVMTNQSQDTEKARTDENNERMAVINYNRNQEMQAVKGDAEAEAAVDAKYQAMTNEANQIHELESMADTVREVADNEVAMRMNFTKEGYEVFKDIHNILKQSSNKQVAEQAKSGAVLFASHADVMANIMQKAGNLDFTAKDYMDQYISIRTGGQVNGQGLVQPINPGVDPNTRVDVVDITTSRSDKINAMKHSELAKYLRSQFKEASLSRDGLAVLGVKDYHGAQHLSWNFTKKKNNVHRGALKKLKALVENAVLIESTKNTKKDLINPMSDSQKRKNEVEYYHRFYVPVSFNNNVYVLRIVGEERQNRITLNPTNVDLYSVIVENKKENTGYPHKSDNLVAGSPTTITIHDMLKGVKDADGNNYFQIAYHGTGYDFTNFDMNRLGENGDLHGAGFYFAEGKDVATKYKNATKKRTGHGVVKKVEIPDDDRLLVEDEPITSNHKDVINNLAKAINDLPSTEKNAFVQAVKEMTNYSEHTAEYQASSESISRLSKNINNIKAIVNGTKKPIKLITSSIDKVLKEYLNVDVDTKSLANDEETLTGYAKQLQDVLDEEQAKLDGIGDTGNNPVTPKMLDEDASKVLDLKSNTGAITGKTVYRAFTKAFNGNNVQTSKWLNQHNIDGLSYTDVEDGKCYVVFDDAAIKLIDEYLQSGQQDTVRGMTSLMADDRKIIDLFETADFSTFVHESGHVFLEDLHMLATMENAPEQVINDWEEVKNWTGYVEGADADTNREAHEKFARGFEAYVRDGSAPTKPLQRAFRQFAKWLTGIYQTFKMLGGKPPRNIRDVMDRMLATDKDIEIWASDREIDRMETKANLKNLSEVEQRVLNQKVADIKDKAKEMVRSEYLKELEDRVVAPWEDVKDEAKARIEKQLADQYPIYKERARYEAFGEDALVNTPHPTLEALEKAEMVEGIGKFHDVVAEQLAAAEETYNASNRTGVDNASLAEEWLLTHEAEQRLRIAEAEMMKAQVQKASARHYKAIRALDKLDFEHGNLENQIKLALGELTDKEQKDLIREIAKANTKEEVQAVKDKLQEQLQRLSALRNMHSETLNAAMKKANARMEKLTISQATKYKQYIRGGVTFGKKADIAFSRGHVYEAYDLKQKQLMRSAMSRVSFEINQEVTKGRDKLLKQLQRISRSKDPIRLGPEARYWYQHMMYQLGLVSRDGVMPADGSFNVTNVYAVLNPDVLLSNSSQQIVNTEVPQSVGMVWFSKKPLDFNQLTVEEYREIEEIMTAIYNNGRNEYQASTIKDDTGTAISIDQAASELVKQLDKVMGGIPDENLLNIQNKQQLTDKASHSLAGMALELVKAETILNRFDGGQKGGGVWYRYIYEPINRATTDAKKRSEVAMKWLSAAINNSYSKEELFNVRNKKGYTIGDISSLTKEQVICAALNWGTEANRQRVLETFNTNEVEVEKAFGSMLDDKDWNFIETTWNHINSYFDERNAVQERLYGTPMKKEEGLTFTINGREIQGQYYPIVYDPQLDSHAADWQIEDVIKSQMTSNAVMGMGMSATKKRNAVVKGKSLWLSLNVIPNAIEESINHIAMREAVTDVNKLIQNHAVEKAIVQTVGREYHQFLKTWVRDQWQTEISKTSKWDRLLGTLRRNSTFAVMGYRTSTAFLNILNVIPAMGKLGPINAVSAIKSFYFGNYMANRQEVMSKSVFLRERIYNLDKDMKNGLKIAGKSPLGTSGIIDHALWKTGEVQDAVNRYGYFFITETDLMLSMPIWKHEYEAKKAELIGKAGYSPEEIENRAIEAGDRAVRSVFGSGDTKDQAGVQRKNNSLVNIFTPFYSYSNTVFNALLEAGWRSKDSGNWLQLAHSVLFWIIIQSVCETLLRSLWDDDKDDAETIAKKSIKAIGSSAVQGFPIVRDILGAVGAAITGDTTTSRGSEVVALSMTSKLSKTIGDALFRQGKVSGSDIGRGLSEVSNRLIPGGFSDTLTDGAWTLAKWLTTNTDASVLDLATAIIMDKKIRTKEEERKFKVYQKRKEHSK